MVIPVCIFTVLLSVNCTTDYGCPKIEFSYYTMQLVRSITQFSIFKSQLQDWIPVRIAYSFLPRVIYQSVQE